MSCIYSAAWYYCLHHINEDMTKTKDKVMTMEVQVVMNKEEVLNFLAGLQDLAAMGISRVNNEDFKNAAGYFRWIRNACQAYQIAIINKNED